MVYFLVQSYRKDVDEKYNSHLYPSYLTSYNLKLGGDQFGLQSGLHDALKFISEKDAQIFMEKGIQVFGKTHEFEIIPFDARVFGRAKVAYVIEAINQPFELTKCDKCWCKNCNFDYGLDVSEFSCLCKYRADRGCFRCKEDNTNHIVDEEFNCPEKA